MRWSGNPDIGAEDKAGTIQAIVKENPAVLKYQVQQELTAIRDAGKDKVAAEKASKKDK
ncbi:MAG: hypothetical protein MZV63_15730 [Marinilabiliales bacterium]|nr:hypothetical protein [Marinilabiliales bacterium]